MNGTTSATVCMFASHLGYDCTRNVVAPGMRCYAYQCMEPSSAEPFAPAGVQRAEEQLQMQQLDQPYAALWTAWQMPDVYKLPYQIIPYPIVPYQSCQAALGADHQDRWAHCWGSDLGACACVYVVGGSDNRQAAEAKQCARAQQAAEERSSMQECSTCAYVCACFCTFQDSPA